MSTKSCLLFGYFTQTVKLTQNFYLENVSNRIETFPGNSYFYKRFETFQIVSKRFLGNVSKRISRKRFETFPKNREDSKKRKQESNIAVPWQIHFWTTNNSTFDMTCTDFVPPTFGTWSVFNLFSRIIFLFGKTN